MAKIKMCKLCGELFLTSQGRSKFCDGVHYRHCEYCGAEFEIKDPHSPSKTCSVECNRKLRKQHAEATSMKLYGVKNAGYIEESQEKIRATCQQKYGVDFPGQAEIQKQHVRETFAKNGGNPQQRPECREKTRKTNMERYGDTNPLGKNSSIRPYAMQKIFEKYGTLDPGNLPEFREKARQTCRKHWGTDYYMQSDAGRERYKEGMLRNYGVEHPTQSPELMQKARETCMRRYGVPHPMQSEEFKQKISSISMKKYNVPWACMRPECKKAQGIQPSQLTLSFANQLKEVISSSIDYEYPVNRFSYDIVVPNRHLFIEVDPTYTHTSAPTKLGNRRPSYHKEKSKAAEDIGFRCIHVFDWDDQSKIIEMLKDKVPVYARKCKVAPISTKECDDFLNSYHLQNTCEGQDIRYGLYHNDQLVQVMTFGKPKYTSQAGWELLRFCSDAKYAVVGGTQKLFKTFISEITPKSVVTYCDKSKFNGTIYSTLGFRLVDEGDPSIHWTKGTKHILDNFLQQEGYNQLFGTSYSKENSNEDLMLKNGWLPVYDCGQSKYEWRE